MNPTLISAGVGLLGSLFGGKSSTPHYVKDSYNLQNSIMRRALGLYDNADLESQDAATVAAYGDSVMNRAMTTLGNYDARAAAAGSSVAKGDTQKDRAKAQVAGDAASQVSELQANLASTRAARQAALLPNAAQAAAGTQAAAYLDQQQAGEQSAQMQGLLAATNLLTGLLPKKRGPNDRLALLNQGGATNPNTVVL